MEVAKSELFASPDIDLQLASNSLLTDELSNAKAVTSTRAMIAAMVTTTTPFLVFAIAIFATSSTWTIVESEECSKPFPSLINVFVGSNFAAYLFIFAYLIRKLYKLDLNPYDMRSQIFRCILYGVPFMGLYFVTSRRAKFIRSVMDPSIFTIFFILCWIVDSLLIPAVKIMRENRSKKLSIFHVRESGDYVVSPYAKMRNSRSSGDYSSVTMVGSGGKSNPSTPRPSATNWGADSVDYFLPPSNDDPLHPTHLLTVLSTEYGMTAFRKHLALELSQENLMFYLAIKHYKTLRERPSVEIVRRLYDRYIDPDAPLAVNLSSKVIQAVAQKLDVLEKINSAACPPEIFEAEIGREEHHYKTIFDQAMLECEMMMRMDTFSRFLQSSLYQNLLVELRAHHAAKEHASSDDHHSITNKKHRSKKKSSVKIGDTSSLPDDSRSVGEHSVSDHISLPDLSDLDMHPPLPGISENGPESPS
jgi:hypothetical protein